MRRKRSGSLGLEDRGELEREILNLWRTRPDLYAKHVLGVVWWPKQVEIALAVAQHKRVMVRASHSVGKTHLAGGLVNWFFDCFRPSITITTAPTALQVDDLLWKEVRMQRQGRPRLKPKSSRMELAPNHFAAGFTAASGDAFQGRHEENVFIVFDEACGIEGQFWTAADAMLTGDSCRMLAIMNPTDPGSRAWQEEEKGRWKVIQVSCLDHPNVVADLAGLPPPFPGAVRASWVEDQVSAWCRRVPLSEVMAGDFEWPPGAGEWFRPSGQFESRVLGRWPTQSRDTVWSEPVWQLCLGGSGLVGPLKLGCDVARYGDDATVIHAARGGVSVAHESHRGFSTSEVAAQIKALVKSLCREGEDPKQVPISVDDDGVGGGVVDQLRGWKVIPISSAGRARDPEGYPNVRSEMWFAARGMAEEGRISVAALPDEVKNDLWRQLSSAKYRLDGQGRRKVEPKDEMKKRLQRSTDDADAFMLCHYGSANGGWKSQMEVWRDLMRGQAG